MKRTLALILTVVLLLCAIPATFADVTTGSITIKNTTKNKDYTVYRIFEATYADSGDPLPVAYTFTKTAGNTDLYAALTATGSPFTLKETTIADTYNVHFDAALEASTISAFLKPIIEANKVPTTQKYSHTADSDSYKFADLPFGFYYIQSSLGATASLDTTTPDVVIIDKNQKPGWDNEPGDYPTDTDLNADPQTIGKFVADYDTATNTAGTYAKSNTAGIGDTISFKINAFVPKYNGDKAVTQYIFTDTMDAAITFVKGSLHVYVDGTEISGYDAKVENQTLTIKVVPQTTWDSEPHLSFVYQATVNEKAVYDNKNTVTLTWKEKAWNDTDPTNTGTAYTGDPLTSHTDTYVLGFSVEKQDMKGNQLTGAKFKLYDAEKNGNEIPVVKVSDGVYRKALASESANYTEIEAGKAKIFGFDEGTYYLNETQTPKGYMILEARQAVTLKNDDTTVKTGADAGYQTTTLVIKNEPGKKLPGTGGEGTYAYFIGGGVLVLLAAVLLLVRKKSTSK